MGPYFVDNGLDGIGNPNAQLKRCQNPSGLVSHLTRKTLGCKAEKDLPHRNWADTAVFLFEGHQAATTEGAS
jgi:hypothetical protein